MALEDERNSAPPTCGPVLITFSNWGASFGSRRILADIDLSLGDIGVTVFMGPVASGKSLLLKVLAGQMSAAIKTSGQLLFDDVQAATLGNDYPYPVLVQQHPRDLAKRVKDALIESQRGPEPLSPLELHRKLLDTLGKLDQHDLTGYFDRLLYDIPRGAMRRVLLIRAALSNNRVLLIDEPTSGLTESESAQVLRLIRRLGEQKCCLVILHHQRQAREIAARVILLAGGHVQADTSARAFFENAGASPLVAQFLRTGSCSAPSLDAPLDSLDQEIVSTGVASTFQHEVESTNSPSSSSFEIPDADRSAPQIVIPIPTITHEATSATAASESFVPESRGPKGFRWLIPGKLAGCPMPGAVAPLEHDLELLRNVGVTILVNLTERPMTQTAIPAFGLRTIHMKVEDRDAPPLLWMKLLLAQVDKFIQQGEVIAVHCFAGLGRTGTVLGAWLVKEGLTADEALRRLRLIEPGFVQSTVQEELLHELETNLLIRAPNI